MRGRVVEFETGRPLAGRRVVVGSSLTKRAPVTETDADGFFEFVVSGAYQALVIDPDGSTISFYQGLTGSEPVLVHYPSPDDSGGERKVAKVTGSLSGGASYPLTDPNDLVIVHFFGSEVTTRAYVGSGVMSQGPDYALWPSFASPQLAGTIVALGIFRDPADSNAYSAAAAMKKLSVVGGDAYTQDLALVPLPLGRVSGKVNVPDGWTFTQTSEYYRFPIPNAKVGFSNAPQTRVNPLTNAGAFEYQLPDLRKLGGQLCEAGLAMEPASDDDSAPIADGSLWSEVCDLPLDGDSIELDFEAVPSVSATAPGAVFGAGVRFAWSRQGSARAPNLVRLEPGLASAETPLISVFTTSVSATLPDLKVWGIELPPAAAYNARPVALASDASNAFAADGLGALTPRSRRISSGSGVPFVVRP